MKFKKWLTIREEENPNVGTDETKSLYKLIDLCWDKYLGETKKFFTHLAKRDNDVSNYLKEIDNEGVPFVKMPPQRRPFETDDQAIKAGPDVQSGEM